MHPDLRVSQKGAVALYGLNRFPVVLYRDEWQAVFESAAVILTFIGTRHDSLSCRCIPETRLRVSASTVPAIAVSRVWCRRSERGAVSVYGIRRRFPVTLYCDQWIRILGSRLDIETFIRENSDALSEKGCCVPDVSLRPRRVPSIVGADNIIRPLAALREQSR